MNPALSVAGGWAVALAIAVPIVVLFWWARRHEPVTGDQVDYNVGRRPQPPAEPAHHAAAPAADATAAPLPAVDAPVPANPQALATPAEPAVLAANTAVLPVHGALPPETQVGVAPVATAPSLATEPRPAVSLPTAAPEPLTVMAAAVTPTATEPAAVKTPEPAPEPPVPVPAAAPATSSQPSAPAPAVIATTASEPEPAPAILPEPAAAPAQSEPAPVAAAEPTGEGDDFSRLFGIDAVAVSALQAAGIRTYRHLAAASMPDLRQILAGAGQPDTDPATWAQQGRFAAGGKWKQLESRFRPKA